MPSKSPQFTKVLFDIGALTIGFALLAVVHSSTPPASSLSGLTANTVLLQPY